MLFIIVSHLVISYYKYPTALALGRWAPVAHGGALPFGAGAPHRGAIMPHLCVSITKKCTEYRIKNNFPIVEKKKIICNICNDPYTKSHKKDHERSERHQGKDNFEDLINQFEKMKIEEKKEYMKKNFLEFTKKNFYCEICNKEMDIMRKYYHIKKSEEHINNMKIKY